MQPVLEGSPLERWASARISSEIELAHLPVSTSRNRRAVAADNDDHLLRALLIKSRGLRRGTPDRFAGNPPCGVVRGLRNIENGKCDRVTDISIHWRTQSRGS